VVGLDRVELLGDAQLLEPFGRRPGLAVDQRPVVGDLVERPPDRAGHPLEPAPVLGGVFEHRCTEVHLLVVAHHVEDRLPVVLDGAHVVLAQFVARLLHPPVVALAHLELVDVTEVGGTLVQEVQKLRLGTDTGDLERRRQSLLAGDVEDLLPLGAV